MTKRQRVEHIGTIRSILLKNGWLVDRWGNFKNDDYRIKMQKTSMRYEVKHGTGWINLRSDYYKNITVTDEGSIILKGRLI